MKREVKIGIFAILIIGCSWAGIRFLSGIDIFRKSMTYYAAYDQIDGVQNASAITVKGVKVGTVTAIQYDPMHSDQVILHLSINRQYPIPDNSVASIVSDGLMGGKAIDITLGDSPQCLRHRDTIPTQQPSNLFARAGSELELLKEQVVEVTSGLSKTLENLNLLLETNHDSISGTLSNLQSISANVDRVLAAEREDLKRAIANMAAFTDVLERNAGELDSTLLNLNRFTGELAEADLTGELEKTLGELNSALAQINNGEGSIGRLLYDEQLYASLNEASENLASLLADLEANPSRYVHFSLFGRSERRELKQAAKAAEKARRDSLKRL